MEEKTMVIRLPLVIAGVLILLAPVGYVIDSAIAQESPMTAKFSWGEFKLNASTAEKLKSGKQLIIKYVTPDVTPPIYVAIRQGVKDAGEKFGVSAEFLGPPNGSDPQAQASIVESLIRAGIDGLVVNCGHADILTPVINSAAAAGIPVMTSNIDCPESHRIAFYGQDLVNSGKVAGDEFLKYFRKTHPVGGNKYKIALFGGDLSWDYVKDRINGFKKSVKGDDIEFVGPYATTYDQSKVYGVVENTFRGDPKIDGIYSVDEGSLGAGTYVLRNGLAGKVTVVGFNFVPGIPELIEKGAIQASIGQYPYQQGYNPVETLAKFLKNGVLPTCTVCDVGADVLDIDNIEQRMPELQKQAQ
jgi:simple sugar transport system substrate-binding protein